MIRKVGIVGRGKKLSHRRANSLTHTSVTWGIGGSEPFLKAAQHAIILSEVEPALLHSRAFSGVKLPVLSKLLINTFHQTTEQGQPNGLRDTCAAYKNRLPSFLCSNQFVGNVWPVW
jgi:hypothetical protein